LWPYENHKNAIISASVLLVVLYVLSEIFLKTGSGAQIPTNISIPETIAPS